MRKAGLHRMTLAWFATLAAYAIASSITPGPNNAMLLASGVNFGFRKSLPHSLGVSFGFFVLLLAVGGGLATVVYACPPIYRFLQALGGAYQLWLAARLAATGVGGTSAGNPSRPLSFMAAALFQWVNPKAWAMALTAMAVFAGSEKPICRVMTIAVFFALLNWPCVALWSWLGETSRDLLASPRRKKWFNRGAAAALAASVLAQTLLE